MSDLYRHYSALMDLASESRQTYLENLADQPELQQQLRQLLTSHAEAVTAIFATGNRAAAEGVVATLVCGDRIDKYCIEELLGSGGMGTVYLGARDDGQFQQQVAIKTVPVALLKSSEAVFNYEAQALAALNHPNVVSVIDAGQDGRGFAYVVMPYVKGTTLSEWLEAAPRTLTQRLTVFRQVLAGISHAHANQVLHRDIKPQNVLIDGAEQAFVIDFGISKLLDSNQGAETFSYLKALSLDFAAPEQQRGDVVTTAADIFSLGCVLKSLCGNHPALLAVANKAAESDPNQRYRTVEKLDAEINAVISGHAVGAYPNRSYNAKLWLRRNRSRVVAAGVATVMATASAWSYYHSHQFAQRQQLLANHNLTLAETMLAQVDVKVVSEIERQRALLASAQIVDVELLPTAQAVRLTLAKVNAYKAIGDFEQSYLFNQRLLELTNSEADFALERAIAEKIRLELDILADRRHGMEQRLETLVDQIIALPPTNDPNWFILADWEIGTTTLSNPTLNRLFVYLSGVLNGQSRDQKVLQRHVEILASSAVSNSDLLQQFEQLLIDVERDLDQVSARRWVNLLHDWYLASNIQGKQTDENITQRLIRNAELLQQLYDSGHPLVYVLAILAKQAEAVNGFALNAQIQGIYDQIDADKLPSIYRVNYLIIELTNAIKHNRYQDAYQIMATVHGDLDRFGENALNYYLQFANFANHFGNQHLHVKHLATLMEHYRDKGNLGHAGYFARSVCTNGSMLSSSNLNDFQGVLTACDSALSFYEQHHGTSSNLYLVTLIAKLRYLVNSGELTQAQSLLADLQQQQGELPYLATRFEFFEVLIKSHIALEQHQQATDALAQLEQRFPEDDRVTLLALQVHQVSGDSEQLVIAQQRLGGLDCQSLSPALVGRFNQRMSADKSMDLGICPGVPQWRQVVGSDEEVEAIYSSVEQFVVTL